MIVISGIVETFIPVAGETRTLDVDAHPFEGLVTVSV
jgi:hypothetical protein